MSGALAQVAQFSGPALRIFDAVPRHHLAHSVTDGSCAPLIQPGEVAVVTDTPGLYPEDGGWYLFEFGSGKRRVREIVQIYERKEGWWNRRPTSDHGRIFCSDGPYGLNQIAEKILGEVVGIYRPKTGAD